MSEASPDPYSLVVSAAKGDIEAQRALAAQALDLATTEIADGRDGTRAFVEALLFARMAAAHGTVADQGSVISIVALASVHGLADYSDATDMVARIAMVADAGVSVAELGLTAIADEVSPEVMEGAKEVRLRLCDEMEVVA